MVVWYIADNLSKAGWSWGYCSAVTLDIVSERIGDYWPLVVVEGRVAGRATLTDDRIPDAVKAQAVIVGALDVD